MRVKIARRNINIRYVDDTTLIAESEEELKSLLIRVKEESENAGLKFSIQKTKIVASSPNTSWQKMGKKMETVTHYFLGSRITVDSDCSHVSKRCFSLERNAMTNLDSILKSRDITLPQWSLSVQFSRSVVSNSLRPCESQHTRPPCPSPTPGVYPNSCPLSRWCHPATSSSVIPFFSCLQSFPASGSFLNSQFFASGGQSSEFQLQHQSFQWIFRNDFL